MDFPINTGTSCKLKWAWSTIYLSAAKTSSCHRVERHSLTHDNFKDFHNLPKKITDRENMLNNIRPTGGCNYCYKIEDVGGTSDRMHTNKSINGITPKELLLNPTETSVTPTILEIYFTNLCNMSCLYCGPYFSSVWENEYKKYGVIFNDENLDNNIYAKNENYPEMLEQLWEWMENNSKFLKKFHILGGEPFFQEEFVKCLDHFENYPNPDCEFVVITNLMVDDKRMDYFIDRFKKLISRRKLKNIQITCSLDCWGSQIEYIRSGLDLNQWQRNFEKLLKLKWIRLQINHTISALSIKYMAELIEKIKEWKKEKNIYISFMTVEQPTFLNPDIFELDFFNSDLENILELLPEEIDFEKSTKEYFLGLKKQINSTPVKIIELKKLHHFLKNIDIRRKTNYEKEFPWLSEVFKEYKII